MTNFTEIRQTPQVGAASKRKTAAAALSSRQPLIPPAAIRAQNSLNASRRQRDDTAAQRRQVADGPTAATTATSSRQMDTSKQATMNNGKTSGSAGAHQEPEPEVWNSIEDLFWVSFSLKFNRCPCLWSLVSRRLTSESLRWRMKRDNQFQGAAKR